MSSSRKVTADDNVDGRTREDLRDAIEDSLEDANDADPRKDPWPESGADGADRSVVLSADAKLVAAWAWRFIGLAIAMWILGKVIGSIWAGILPILIAVLLCTVLWPPTKWMKDHKIPITLSVILTLLGFVAIFSAVVAAIAPTFSTQGKRLFESGKEGVYQLGDWIQGPPLNAQAEQVDQVIDEVFGWLQDQASNIASGVFSGLSAASSALVTFGVAVILSFFFLKDGSKLLPTIRGVVGQNVGWHLSEVLTRTWNTLGGYIRAQAAVSAIDAVIIGLGLWILKVPMALALAVITFFAGFIPIVGAFSAGALAVLIALVDGGLKTAIFALILIVLVQQLEGNILSPMLQSKAMDLHPVVVLLSVTVGGGLFGIIGAFLAVPVAAAVAVWIRYHQEMVSLRTGEITYDDIKISTADGDPSITTEEAFANVRARFKRMGGGRTKARTVVDSAVEKQREGDDD
ncbi:AI-2E family transporter [Corynebacterium glucuronolyticum]|uniref:AI-2E family transporter n=1 Tax=Corynebacterium glucuronolyticum TaxID=39791 RepID=UPI003F6DC168